MTKGPMSLLTVLPLQAQLLSGLIAFSKRTMSASLLLFRYVGPLLMLHHQGNVRFVFFFDRFLGARTSLATPGLSGRYTR